MSDNPKLCIHSLCEIDILHIIWICTHTQDFPVLEARHELRHLTGAGLSPAQFLQSSWGTALTLQASVANHHLYNKRKGLPQTFLQM